MRAALFNAQAGLRADKLGAEFLTLQVTLRRIVGGREEPDADKRHGDLEQRRVFIREDSACVAEDLHPDGRAQNHQDHRRQQPQPAANHRAARGQLRPVHGEQDDREVAACRNLEGQPHHKGDVLLLKQNA